MENKREIADIYGDIRTHKPRPHKKYISLFIAYLRMLFSNANFRDFVRRLYFQKIEDLKYCSL